jgi:cold shock CspA family protein
MIEIGVISRFNWERRFGWIEMKGGGEMWFHANDAWPQNETFAIGDRVSFVIKPDRKRPERVRATHVKVTGRAADRVYANENGSDASQVGTHHSRRRYEDRMLSARRAAERLFTIHGEDEYY